MLTIQVSDDIERRLESLAKATGRTVGFHAERAIVEYLGDLDDYDAAEREMDEVRAGRSIPVPLAELLKANGLAD